MDTKYKDMIRAFIFLGTLLICYTTTIKNHEIRISVLESEQHTAKADLRDAKKEIARILVLESEQSSMKEDLREIKKDIKKLLEWIGKK